MELLWLLLIPAFLAVVVGVAVLALKVMCPAIPGEDDLPGSNMD